MNASVAIGGARRPEMDKGLGMAGSIGFGAAIIAALRRWPGAAVHNGERVIARIPRGHLDRLMRRIIADPRHTGLRVLSDMPIPERRLQEPIALTADPAALLLMAGLAILSLALGRWLGGRDRREGLTTALVTAMRNPGLALLFASTHGKDLPGLKLWILAYVLVTLLVSMPLVRRSRQVTL